MSRVLVRECSRSWHIQALFDEDPKSSTINIRLISKYLSVELLSTMALRTLRVLLTLLLKFWKLIAMYKQLRQ